MARITRKSISLNLIDVDFSRNVREQNDASYDDPAMRDSLALVGQQTTAKLLKKGDRYEPIQGNRRVFNMKKLAAAGVIDPKTAKRDEDGNIIRDEKTGIPVGGRVFETIEAEVYEGLSERERVELLVDHGTIRVLNKAELFYAAEFLFSAGYSEKEVVIMLFGLLAQHYPPTRQIKDTKDDGGQDALEYYRGVVQTMKDAWRSPVVVRDSWVTKLKTGRSWPLKKEMTQGYSIYKTEQDTDKTGRISRQKPGPKFTAFWDKVVQKHADAEASGEKRAKSSAMMNHQQLNDKVLDSRTLKAMRGIILRGIGEDQLAVLDAALVKYEDGSITKDEYSNILDSIFGSSETETPTVETTPSQDVVGTGTPAEQAEVNATDAAAEVNATDAAAEGSPVA